MYRLYKKIVLSVAALSLVGTLSVHMFDAEFAGKFTQEDNSEVVAKGEKLYKKYGCIGCHGSDGNTPTDEKFPNIGGQSRFYVEQQLKDIRDGRRDNGGTSMMKASMQKLTDDEAYIISVFLSEL